MTKNITASANNAEKRANRKSVFAAKRREEALDHIKCAISALGQEALDGDSVAKEAIANLGVVMFDLK